MEIRKVRGQARDFQLESQGHDLVKANALEAKLKLVEALVNDLEMVITRQKALAERLRQPFQEEQLKLEAKYHCDAVSLFENIGKIIIDKGLCYNLLKL